VNLTNGNLTPFVQHLQTTKGLVYVDASGSTTPLALNGSTAGSGSSDTGLIIGIIAAALVVLGGGAYLLSRRGSTAG
jgi:hypothetical protein